MSEAHAEPTAAIPHTRFRLRRASRPIREPVTKFGGDPTWVATPAWPLSRSTGRPMHFLAQVALPEGLIPGRCMAYVFMADAYPHEDYIDSTWDPDSGENAVVLQPGSFACHVPTAALAQGPTLWKHAERCSGGLSRFFRRAKPAYVTAEFE